MNYPFGMTQSDHVKICKDMFRPFFPLGSTWPKDPTHLTSLPGSVRVGIRAALVPCLFGDGHFAQQFDKIKKMCTQIYIFFMFIYLYWYIFIYIYMEISWNISALSKPLLSAHHNLQRLWWCFQCIVDYMTVSDFSDSKQWHQKVPHISSSWVFQVSIVGHCAINSWEQRSKNLAA